VSSRTGTLFNRHPTNEISCFVNIGEGMTLLSKVLLEIGYVICYCVLTEDLLSFIASRVSKMTVNPCNKPLLLCAMFSFQLIELNADFFCFFLFLF
jgi:hypothetical protein